MIKQFLASFQQNTDYAKVPEVPYGSHLIRLSWIEWIIVFVILGLLFHFAPWGWSQIEPFPMQDDFRIPYKLSNDYWLFSRYCEQIKKNQDIFVLGDSVVWGEYVHPEETFSHYLNENEVDHVYRNVGVNGIHPISMYGLLCYYAGSIQNQSVLLHCNPLWMSSPQRDLQVDKEIPFNHPELTAQFFSPVPCYRASFSDRAGIVAERNAPFLQWMHHIRIAYFDNSDMPSWTLEHPYVNPVSTIHFDGFQNSRELRHDPVPWTEKGTKQDFPWVSLDSSLQWKSFQKAVRILQDRGNSIFVLVGPFNEHMLEPESLRQYQSIRDKITAWLKEESIPSFTPSALPSHYYADASHPLKEGYSMLAGALIENTGFKQWRKGISINSF